jgi:hypothetical protein
MDALISALERSLSQTHEPALRRQLTDTINRLRKRRRPEAGRVPPRRRRRLPARVPKSSQTAN